MKGDREAERLPFILEISFFASQHADKNGRGLWTFFIFNMLFLMYGLQIFIQLSDTDILKLEPKAVGET